MNAGVRPPAACGLRHLFVYWHAAPADVPAALQALRALHVALRARHAGLQCAVYLRNQPGATQATLMETYAMDAAVANEGLDLRLQQDIDSAAAAAVAPWQSGARHLEAFDAADA